MNRYQLIVDGLDSAAIRLSRTLQAGIGISGFIEADFQDVVEMIRQVTEMRDTYWALLMGRTPPGRPKCPPSTESPELPEA